MTSASAGLAANFVRPFKSCFLGPSRPLDGLHFIEMHGGCNRSGNRVILGFYAARDHENSLAALSGVALLLAIFDLTPDIRAVRTAPAY